jgi:hypothetical protein
MANGKSKGTTYERTICQLLSHWWTNDEESSIFWRTATSGGRATSRHKKGQKTRNQVGDICATDPIGQPLLDLVTLELKKGYSSHTIMSIIDETSKAGGGLYREWLEKLMAQHQQAGTPYWLLIVKRDRREAMVYMPWELGTKLNCDDLNPHIIVCAYLNKKEEYIMGCHLEAFLSHVQPSQIISIRNKMKKVGK